jgi:hypothetical protein
MFSADRRHELARELGLDVQPDAKSGAKPDKKRKNANGGIRLPRPFGASPSDVQTVDLTAKPENAGQLAACLNVLFSIGLDTRVSKGSKAPLYTPTHGERVNDAAMIAQLEAIFSQRPWRRALNLACYYAKLSRQVGLCARPYECATATHACRLTGSRPLFPGFCATCTGPVRGIVTAAIIIHDMCMPFEAANAAKYVHVFFRECLRFHWSRRVVEEGKRDASDAAYFGAWVLVCARRIFERLEAYHVDDVAHVEAMNSECVLPLTLGARPACDMVFPGYNASIDDDKAPYATAACNTCKGLHRVALAPGQSPAPNPPKKKDEKKNKTASESAAKRKAKSSAKHAAKRSRSSANEHSGDADGSSASPPLPLAPSLPPAPAPALYFDNSMHTTELGADRDAELPCPDTPTFPSFDSDFMGSSMLADDDGHDARGVRAMLDAYRPIQPIIPAQHTALALPPLPSLSLPAPAPMHMSAAAATSAPLDALAHVAAHVPRKEPAPKRVHVILEDEEA